MSLTQEVEKANTETETVTEVESQRNECITLIFNLKGENFGLDVNDVREIVRVPPFITRIPNAPGYVRGVINLRGTIVPVLDVAIKIGGDSEELTGESRIVVVEYSDVLFGILVDAVREVCTIYDSQVEQVSDMGSSVEQEYIRGVAKLEEGQLIVLLDLPALFDMENLQQDRDGQ